MDNIKDSITSLTVVGVGAGGSAVAHLASKKYSNAMLTLIDFDVVEDVNVATQLYEDHDIGLLKVEALANRVGCAETCTSRVEEADKKYLNSKWIHLGVDNFESRQYALENVGPDVKYVTDIRMKNTFLQCYAIPRCRIREYYDIVNADILKDIAAIQPTPTDRCNTRSGYYVACIAAGIVIQMMEELIKGYNDILSWCDDIGMVVAPAPSGEGCFVLEVEPD